MTILQDGNRRHVFPALQSLHGFLVVAVAKESTLGRVGTQKVLGQGHGDAAAAARAVGEELAAAALAVPLRHRANGLSFCTGLCA